MCMSGGCGGRARAHVLVCKCDECMYVAHYILSLYLAHFSLSLRPSLSLYTCVLGWGGVGGWGWVGGYSLLRDTEELEREECLFACRDARFIVFNLFALCCWHIAEYLGVGCVAVTPYLMPSAASSPHRVRAYFASHPTLQRVALLLRRNQTMRDAVADLPRGPCYGSACAVTSSLRLSSSSSSSSSLSSMSSCASSSPPPFYSPSQTSSSSSSAPPAATTAVPLAFPMACWDEVEFWMWPLFSPSHCRWRRERLELSPIPFADCLPLELRRRPRDGGVGEERREDALGGEALAVAVEGETAVASPAAARSTPLLLGFSNAVQPPEGFWPPSVHVTGFWYPGPRPPPDADPRQQQQQGQETLGVASNVAGTSLTDRRETRITADPSATPPQPRLARHDPDGGEAVAHLPPLHPNSLRAPTCTFPRSLSLASELSAFLCGSSDGRQAFAGPVFISLGSMAAVGLLADPGMHARSCLYACVHYQYLL